MVASTQVKKRRVMTRDHDDVARYISSELKRREGLEYRKSHERRWVEVDRQIAMEAPFVLDRTGRPEEPGEWHNAIQLGDLTDASETITADILRLVFPSERKFFIAHVELEPTIDGAGNLVQVPPHEQKAVNGSLRSLMVQQHKDFGVRERVKLAVKEILHHGSVVITMEEEKIFKYKGGTKPDHLKAPVPVVHSMWDCFPDPSPSVYSTENFYRGSMIMRRWMPLQQALEMPDWINKDKLQEQHAKRELDDHIEILVYYGDIFLKRHDGNVLFPNRKTIVSGTTFLHSEVNKTDYSPVIYTGYERNDVRDPYYTSPIVKRAPMGKFVTHMANRTLDSVDLSVKPPITYDSLDNSHRGNGPEIYPGAKIPTRGGTSISTLDVGDPAVGLAAMQWGKQQLQEGTTVDAVRKGVSPGTEQTATEVLQTEQRAEVREVEFAASLEPGVILPMLIMQHDMNLVGMGTYPFYNDEIDSPDFVRFKRSDLPKSVIFEATGSRSILGEQERATRFAQTAALAGQNESVSNETDWTEVARQLWEESKQKDPERFLRSSDQNAEVEKRLQEQQQQFQQAMADLQKQAQEAMAAAQKAEDARRAADVKADQAKLKEEQTKLEKQQLQLEKVTLQEQIKLSRQMEQAADRLEKLERDIREREIKMNCETGEASARAERETRILGLAERLAQ